MPYTFTLTTTIPASPEEIYQAWLDSLAHSEMTGGAANMSEQIGAEVSAWDGYISGRNLELVPGERIVQSWRTSEFADEHGELGDHDPAPGSRRGDLVDARAQQCAGRTAELRRGRLARELFRADGGLFYRAQARSRGNVAAEGCAQNCAQACNQNGAQRQARSRRKIKARSATGKGFAKQAKRQGSGEDPPRGCRSARAQTRQAG